MESNNLPIAAKCFPAEAKLKAGQTIAVAPAASVTNNPFVMANTNHAGMKKMTKL